MTDLETRLAAYIEALLAAREGSHRPEERTLLTNHLAAAAAMASAITSRQLPRLAELIADEERTIGWSYMPGESGGNAERAFHELSAEVAARVKGPHVDR